MASTTVSSWQAFFQGIPPQDDLLDKFVGILSGGSAAQRTADACADPTVALLAASTNHQILFLHHLHHDHGTPTQHRSMNIWALMGPDHNATSMVIPPICLNKCTDRMSTPSWSEFNACTNIDEIIALETIEPTNPSAPPPPNFRPHALLQPMPSFITKALMNVRSQDAFTLCFTAKQAIFDHANAINTQQQPLYQNQTPDETIQRIGSHLNYIIQFLWSIGKASESNPPENGLITKITNDLTESAALTGTYNCTDR